MKRGFILSAIVTGFFVSTSFGYDWSANPGDGSEGNPYQISEPNQLIAIGADPNLLDMHFILVNDIVFDPNNNPDHVFTAAVIAPDLENSTGFQGSAFEGSLNGSGYSITNLLIEDETAENDYLGLIGQIGEEGSICNLALKNVSIQGDDYLGAIAGQNYGDIERCCSEGSIHGQTAVGGICGINYIASIENCYATGQVTGYAYVGGLCGSNVGSIRNSFATGNVTGFSTSGGLTGRNYYAAIVNCYSTGPVTGTDGSHSLGGLCGNFQWNSYLARSYTISPVTAGAGAYDLGSLCGAEVDSPNPNSYIDCIWNTEINPGLTGIGNITDPAGVIGKNTVQMQRVSTYTAVNWDFMGETANGTSDDWRMCADGIHYPKLSWEFRQTGDYACPDGVWMDDLEALAVNWLTDGGNPAFKYSCDGSGDGQINHDDFEILSRNWLSGPPRIISSQVGDCTRIEESGGPQMLLDEDDPLRFTVMVQGSHILFEDPIWANCCIGGIELVLVIEGNVIRLEEHEIPQALCTCMCTYPTTAVLGPFQSGEYVFEVIQISEFEMIPIGQVPVVIE